MNTFSDSLIDNFLKNISVNVIIADKTMVGKDWGTNSSVFGVHKFYYILDGEAYFKINNEEYVVGPGQLYWLPAGTRQTFKTTKLGKLEKYWRHFSVLPENSDIFEIITFPYFVQVKDRAKVEALFSNMKDYYNNKKVTSSIHLKALLLEIMCYYFENLPMERKLAKSERMIQNLTPAIDYINNNITNNISVEDVAKTVGLHPNYFMSVFKKHMGISIIKYINQRKMEIAKKLLKNHEYSVSEIADMLGFDVYYFSKIFKQSIGLPPSEFRKMVISDSNTSSS